MRDEVLGEVRADNQDVSDSDFEPELDESRAEYNLRLTDPVGYSWNVDGIRQIFVKDDSIAVRWAYEDGEVKLIGLEVF